MKGRRKWDDIFTVLKNKNLSIEKNMPGKTVLQNEGKRKDRQSKAKGLYQQLTSAKVQVETKDTKEHQYIKVQNLLER